MNRILVVDDDPALLRLLKSVLDHGGFAHETAATAQQALRMFNAGTFDAVLLDLALPDLHGSELITFMRDRSDLPILVISRDPPRPAGTGGSGDRLRSRTILCGGSRPKDSSVRPRVQDAFGPGPRPGRYRHQGGAVSGTGAGVGSTTGEGVGSVAGAGAGAGGVSTAGGVTSPSCAKTGAVLSVSIPTIAKNEKNFFIKILWFI